jgi:Rod binding domain-containing protein
MTINPTNSIAGFTTGVSGTSRREQAPQNSEDVAMEFERIFARQLVSEMARGLFDNGTMGEGIMQSGNQLYRDHIIETLSAELAKQEPLGISEMVRRHLSQTETTE